MTNNNNVKKKYTTGKGELTGFLAINKPSQQYDTYNVQILLSKQEGAALVKELEDLRQEQFIVSGKKGKLVEVPCKPYTIQDDTGKETPDPEGRYILKAGGKGHNSKGEALPKPKLFNAKLQPITGQVNIGEGTTARLSVVFSGYKAPIGIGITAKLKGCQIINLVEYTSSGCSASDFDVEEDGFDGVGEEVKEEPAVTVTQESGDEEETPDF